MIDPISYCLARGTGLLLAPVVRKIRDQRRHNSTRRATQARPDPISRRPLESWTDEEFKKKVEFYKTDLKEALSLTISTSLIALAMSSLLYFSDFIAPKPLRFDSFSGLIFFMVTMLCLVTWLCCVVGLIIGSFFVLVFAFPLATLCWRRAWTLVARSGVERAMPQFSVIAWKAALVAIPPIAVPLVFHRYYAWLLASATKSAKANSAQWELE
jgi:hypothetical protein